MTARSETYSLAQYIQLRTGKALSFDDANTLRRAQITLRRWAEQECGDSNDYASFSIERDEQTQIPYRVYLHTDSKVRRTRIADREAGALRRIKDVCDRNGYSSRGVACCEQGMTMYTVHAFQAIPGAPVAGDLILSAQTREKLILALANRGLHFPEGHKLPRFGREMVVCTAGRGGYVYVVRRA